MTYRAFPKVSPLKTTLPMLVGTRTGDGFHTSPTFMAAGGSTVYVMLRYSGTAHFENISADGDAGSNNLCGTATDGHAIVSRVLPAGPARKCFVYQTATGGGAITISGGVVFFVPPHPWAQSPRLHLPDQQPYQALILPGRPRGSQARTLLPVAPFSRVGDGVLTPPFAVQGGSTVTFAGAGNFSVAAFLLFRYNGTAGSGPVLNGLWGTSISQVVPGTTPGIVDLFTNGTGGNPMAVSSGYILYTPPAYAR